MHTQVRTNQNKNKTHCVNGHEFSGDNLRIGTNGWRICKECQRVNVGRYHASDKGRLTGAEYRATHQAERREQGRVRRIKARKFVYSVKSAPCVDCEQSYPPYVMDLDHVRGVKTLDVSTMVDMGYRMSTLIEEISKCDVVCSNCHRLRTHKRRGTIV